MHHALVATIVALRLPAGFTVDPESDHRIMAVAANGSVAATMQRPGDSARRRAVRWNARGVASVFVPLPPLPRMPTSRDTDSGVSALAADGTAFVDVGHPFSGAFSGEWYDVERWSPAGAVTRDASGCGNHAGAAASDGRRIVWSGTEGSSFTGDEAASGSLAPRAALTDGARCTPIGAAIGTALRGAWAAGYRGYFGHGIAPSNVAVQNADLRAVRWHRTALEELGPGVGLGVNASGVVVGANGLPYGGPRTARRWTQASRSDELPAAGAASVAYDVGDDGTVVGMVQTADGKHFAVRWRAGRLERLDDVPHPPGWRFECAYTIAPDGAIVGIGTLHGVATAFVWRAPR